MFENVEDVNETQKNDYLVKRSLKLAKNGYLALVHSPVLNKRGEIVTTSVTNLDLHDLCRTCKTYGLVPFFVTPLKAQHELVKRILGHWESDEANSYNPDRVTALREAYLVNSVEEVIEIIEKIEGIRPIVTATGANFKSYEGGERELHEKMLLDKKPPLLLFGTGWGLAPEIVEQAEFKLRPLKGDSPSGYNHLPVRSAVAIYCDRLFGERVH